MSNGVMLAQACPFPVSSNAVGVKPTARRVVNGQEMAGESRERPAWPPGLWRGAVLETGWWEERGNPGQGTPRMGSRARGRLFMDPEQGNRKRGVCRYRERAGQRGEKQVAGQGLLSPTVWGSTGQGSLKPVPRPRGNLPQAGRGGWASQSGNLRTMEHFAPIIKGISEESERQKNVSLKLKNAAVDPVM